MAAAKRPVVQLSELSPGQSADFFALLKEKTRGQTRDGKPFYSCRFADARRTVGFMAWADSSWYELCEREWNVGKFYKIRGEYGEHERYGPQIDIHNIRPVQDADRADGFDALDFIERTRFDPGAMFAELLELARRHIADAPLRQLVETLLTRHADAFKRLPATTRHCYPFGGGLLEHTLSVTRSCLLLIDKYQKQYADLRPPLSRDVVIAGAILHDLGRVQEFGSDPITVQRTVPGKLVGPLFLGRDLVRDAAREQGNVSPDLLHRLEHVLVAHLNLLERDSPRVPMTPECLIVHHADALDAYLEMYARGVTRDTAEGPFTDRDPVLGRQWYKGD